MQLGSWSTFDCPTGGQKVEDKAYEWLRIECDRIGVGVRKVMNSHDFGPYPSFEIDCDVDEEFKGKDREYVIDVLNDLEKRYGVQFRENL